MNKLICPICKRPIKPILKFIGKYNNKYDDKTVAKCKCRYWTEDELLELNQ